MDDIREKWELLFEMRAEHDPGDECEQCDRLASELESWAREAEAGRLLDWVCGLTLHPDPDPTSDVYYNTRIGEPPRYSTDPAAAMDALGRTRLYLKPVRDDEWACDPEPDGALLTVHTATANTPQLAIARCVAVLAARGVLLGEVDGE